MTDLGSSNTLTLSMERVNTQSSYTTARQKRKKDQILMDALKISSDEVQETKLFENRFNLFREPLSSYNSIRETYRLIKDAER